MKDEFGFDLDFAIDPLEHLGSSVVDTINRIPGGSLLTGAVSDFVTGPMRDFARTPLGETIMRASSVAMSQALYVLPVVGYTLGFLAWSVPGLAKGEPFNEALAKEFIFRVEYVAEMFGGKAVSDGVKSGVNKMMSDQMQRAVNSLEDMAKKSGVSAQTLLAKAGMSPAVLAKQLGIREDVAAYAIEWFKGQSPKMLALINQAYNPDGSMKDAVKKALSTMSYPAGSPCAQLELLRKQGLSENSGIPALRAVFMQQKALCDEWQLNDAIRRANDPNAGNTLGKRKLPLVHAPSLASVSLQEQVTRLEASLASAMKAGQSPAIVNALKTKLANARAQLDSTLTSYPPTEVNAEDQAALIEWARKGAEQAATVPAVNTARQFTDIPLYRFGFDVATGLCKGMSATGPAQDRIAGLLDGSKLFKLPDGTSGVGNAACVKGFRVGQALQHGITKSLGDPTVAQAAAGGPDAAAGAFVTAGLAGSPLTPDQKADIMTTVTNNPGATAGATTVANQKVGWFKRLLLWLHLAK